MKSTAYLLLLLFISFSACKKESLIAPDACLHTTTAWQSDTITVNELIHFTYCGKLSSAQANFQYNFGDGTFSDSLTVEHSYNLPGTYTIVLTVSVENRTSVDSVKITVMPLATNQSYAGNYHAVQTCYGDSVVQSSFNSIATAVGLTDVSIQNFSDSATTVTLNTSGNHIAIPLQSFSVKSIAGYGSLRPDYSQLNLTYYLLLNTDTVGVCYQLLKKQ
ncbi:MAG: PKD domain-containing protein [Chitinophagales bacterium]